jgi:hypothetical protein
MCTEAEGFRFFTTPTSRTKRVAIEGKKTKTNTLISADEILV